MEFGGRGPRRRDLAAVFAAAAIAAVSCGESSTSQSLAQVVLSGPPPGYAAEPLGDNGNLSLDQASAATPADPPAVQGYLQSHAWRGAYGRVWTSGSDYAEVLGYAFAAAAQAQGFVNLQVSQLQSSPANEVYPLAEVPGAEAFILYSQTRVGNRDVFCNGVWFAVRERSFEVLTCGATPGSGSLAAQLAAQQLQQAGGTPAPSSPAG